MWYYNKVLVVENLRLGEELRNEVEKVVFSKLKNKDVKELMPYLY